MTVAWSSPEAFSATFFHGWARFQAMMEREKSSRTVDR
jgi:hypothetical protein